MAFLPARLDAPGCRAVSKQSPASFIKPVLGNFDTATSALEGYSEEACYWVGIRRQKRQRLDSIAAGSEHPTPSSVAIDPLEPSLDGVVGRQARDSGAGTQRLGQPFLVGQNAG
ncbi:MAG: hypothetical protein ACK4NZ_14100, partial [Tsuneonella sp.]